MLIHNKTLKIPSPFEMLKSFRNPVQRWKLKNPNEKLCYLYGFGRMASRVIAVPIFNNDRPLCWWSHFALVYFGMDVVLCLYTVVYYAIHGDFAECLPSTCMMVGPAIIVSVHH